MEPHTSSPGGIDPEKTEMQRAASADPSCASIKSDPKRTQGTEIHRAVSPEPSCVSMKSDQSNKRRPNFSSEPSDPTTEIQRVVSPESSCVSMKSDQSNKRRPNFCSEPSYPDIQEKKTNTYMETLDRTFKELEEDFISLVRNELCTFKKLLSPDSAWCGREVQEEDDQRRKDRVLKITLDLLRNMKRTDFANMLKSKLVPACHAKLKSELRDKCKKIHEGNSGHGQLALLNEVFTDLYITEGGSGGVNQEHEVRKIETASRKRKTQETPISCNDIFKPLRGQNYPVRTVLTNGVAGIGKTVSVQKFILDWSEGKVSQDVLFIFPLPFRELNLMKEKSICLMNLLQCFFSETKDLKPKDYKHYKIMFIFDGLDECRLPLDFKNNRKLVDIEEPSSVDVLLTNLIKGNLLPSALLWITSRPAAVSQIPPECVDQVTEVRGFSEPQKEEYFKKRISDQDLANKVFTHIKSSRSLYIMCHIPVFCWITATVLERMLSETKTGEIPKTLTQMFTHFLIFQLKQKENPLQTRESVLALGKLAFEQLESGNLIFYEEDLEKSGIDIRELPGVCTQIFREEEPLHLGKVFSFVHLTIQEFLAALYAFQCFMNTTVLKQENAEQENNELSQLFSKPTMADFLNSAVNMALQSESGHLDLFLRFLLGLSLKSNQTLLRGVLTLTEKSSFSETETVKFIKEKIEKNASPEKSINLFHCLNELNDRSLEQKVQEYVRQHDDSHVRLARLSPAQWSALAFVLLNSDEQDEFDLSKYVPSEECFLRLLPVVKESRRVVLASCNLGEKICENLGSVLNLKNSLIELDLSNNDLKDSGVELLSAGLRSSHCKLQTLRLALCNIGANACENLGSVLKWENSCLKEMDLSNNDLQDVGVELLSVGLKSSHCKLQILRLSACMVTEKGCSSLASALSSNPYHLKELDLTYNHPGDSVMMLFSAGLDDSHCRLRVDHGEKFRIKPGLKKYACEFTLDPNTTHSRLSLSEGNRKAVRVKEQQSYPDHPERFDYWVQVMSRERVSGRCYWEAEWSEEETAIAVTYESVTRKGDSEDCGFGMNKESWCLSCSDVRYSVCHNKKRITVAHPPPGCRRVGVYVDCPAGTLSFYSVFSDTHTLTHLHTFHTTFTDEPLYAGFRLCKLGSAVFI